MPITQTAIRLRFGTLRRPIHVRSPEKSTSLSFCGYRRSLAGSRSNLRRRGRLRARNDRQQRQFALPGATGRRGHATCCPRLRALGWPLPARGRPEAAPLSRLPLWLPRRRVPRERRRLQMTAPRSAAESSLAPAEAPRALAACLRRASALIERTASNTRRSGGPPAFARRCQLLDRKTRKPPIDLHIGKSIRIQLDKRRSRRRRHPESPDFA